VTPVPFTTIDLKFVDGDTQSHSANGKQKDPEMKTVLFKSTVTPTVKRDFIDQIIGVGKTYRYASDWIADQADIYRRSMNPARDTENQQLLRQLQQRIQFLEAQFDRPQPKRLFEDKTNSPADKPCNQAGGETLPDHDDRNKKRRKKRSLLPQEGVQPVSERTENRRVAELEQRIRAECDATKEDFEIIVSKLLDRRSFATEAALSAAVHAKNGKILAKLRKFLNKSTKDITKSRLVECAQLLEELCITDDSYHKLRMGMDLQNQLPALCGVKKTRTELNKHIETDWDVASLDVSEFDKLVEGGRRTHPPLQSPL
jgi:hypothetical protein